MCGETMTGNAFLKRLSFQLDFLCVEDQKVVLDFYQRKLAGADTLLEEEAMVKSFGSPEHIAKKLKESYLNIESVTENEDAQVPASSSENNIPEEHTSLSALPKEEQIFSDLDNSSPIEDVPAETDGQTFPDADIDSGIVEESDDRSLENEVLDDDLIFSRPPMVQKAPEIVHSLENKEVKSLYGEKVVIESREQPIEQIPLDPIDDENGFTPEEIELAKAETLEKAESYNTTSFGVPETDMEAESIEESEESETREEVEIPPQLEEDETDEPTPNEVVPGKSYPGLLNKIFSSSSLSGKTIGIFKILITILISPLLLLFFGVGAIAYAVCSAFIILLCVLLFALIAALLVGGVVELIYGVAMLFDTVSIALIEIGVGTVLFAFVTAIAALIYEFIFGFVPKILKGLTDLIKRYFRIFRSYLYGGIA